jgi:adenylylsulfate kinase-like enzyme
MRMRKILVMGLPGAGKTTLATTLAPLLNAVVFNADAVRANISRDLGFGHADRIEHISASRFEDTNRMFVPPKRFDLRVRAEGTPQYWAEQALARLRPSFDPSNVRRLGVAP